MVNAALTLGGIVGVLLSGGFVYYEVGRFAEPQVPRTLFDERKEVFAYTAGLFVGVPLALPWILFLTSLDNQALLGGLVFVAFLVAGAELAQVVLLRVRYFGAEEARPFYALGFRAGIGGILALAVVARYLGGGAVTGPGIGLMLLQAVGLVAVEVATALLALPSISYGRRVGGGVLPAAVFSGVGIVLLGSGELLGPALGSAAAAIAIVGGVGVYARLRSPILGRVLPPRSEETAEMPEAESRFGRTDR